MLEEAFKKYTEAIDLKIKDKINAILYSNRAYVNLKLERNGAALEDANKAIEWDPDYLKGYYRRGCANFLLCKYEEALIDLEYVYKVYPKEHILIDKIQELEKTKNNKSINNMKSNKHTKGKNSSYFKNNELKSLKKSKYGIPKYTYVKKERNKTPISSDKNNN